MHTNNRKVNCCRIFGFVYKYFLSIFVSSEGAQRFFLRTRRPPLLLLTISFGMQMYHFVMLSVETFVKLRYVVSSLLKNDLQVEIVVAPRIERLPSTPVYY